MTNTERAAYIRGLMNGLELNPEDKTTQVLNAMMDLLDEMALSLSEVETSVDEMADQLDEVDEDLGTLEEEFYGIGDDDDEEDDDDDDGFDDDTEYYEVTCPTCNQTVCIDEDMAAEGSMDCPNCGEHLEFDFDENEDEEGSEA